MLRRGALLMSTVSIASPAALSATGTPEAEAAGPRLDRAEQALVRAVNRARAAHGRRPVRADRRLGRAADAHSRDMLRRDFVAHTSSDGTSMFARVNRYRRSRRAGEAIAYMSGKRKRGAARRIVRRWMRSGGHRAAILDPGFRRLGIGRRSGRLGSTRATVYTADLTTRR